MFTQFDGGSFAQRYSCLDGANVSLRPRFQTAQPSPNWFQERSTNPIMVAKVVSNRKNAAFRTEIKGMLVGPDGFEPSTSTLSE